MTEPYLRIVDGVDEIDPRPKRRCPACAEPDNFLVHYQSERHHANSYAGLHVVWVWDPPPTYVHRYRCQRCGHVVERTTQSSSPY